MTKLTPQEETTLRTYNKQAQAWASQHASEGFWRQELQQFKKLLPKGRILEVGCGGGRDAETLLKMGYEYVGTDISEGLLNIARKRNPLADFKLKSLYDLDFDEPFDGFWCAAVLLHVPKNRIDEALQAISQCLRTGAIGFIAIKQGSGEGIEKRSEKDKRLFSYWSAEDFNLVLKANGFKVLAAGQKPAKEEKTWLTYYIEKI